jgi:DNA-binding LacI/PurR family transcriptional regulator
MAFGALQAIRDMGLKCPQDISLVGFDNLETCEYVEPALTTVSQSPYDMGAKAVEVAMRTYAPDSDGAERVVLPVEMVLRNSVRRLMP